METHALVDRADLFSFLHCAINYALGRRTYITETVAGQVRCYWHHLTEGQKQTLTRNLKSDIAAYDLARKPIGDACDDTGWRSLLKWMEKSMEVLP